MGTARSITVAFVQAEAAVAETELPCPVRLGQARVHPGAVVPAAVRLGVHFQTGLDEVQLRLVQLLHLILLSRHTDKQITVFKTLFWSGVVINGFGKFYSFLINCAFILFQNHVDTK